MKTENSKTKVAIIGIGKIGEVIASNLIRGNHAVILASRDVAKAKSAAEKLGRLAVAKETRVAIKEADIVIPTIYFNSLKEFIKTYSEELLMFQIQLHRMEMEGLRRLSVKMNLQE